jgi:protease IV
MTIDKPVSSINHQTLTKIAIWGILPIVAGILISLLIPRPKIGIIYLNDAIYAYTSHNIQQELAVARESNDVKAVVLVVNSPGGTVTDTESLYREVISLRQTKPVVTVIEGMAASGGYYLACATDLIYAKASPEVGNIGVIGTQPDKPTVFEDIYSTGPYKMWGMPRDSFSRELEMLKQGFLQAVKLGRGDRLKMTDEMVLRGEVYTGGDAVRLGLIDGLASQSEAIDQAARLAGLRNYQTLDLFTAAGLTQQQLSMPLGFFKQDASGNVTSFPAKTGNYLLYIPGLGEAQ